MATHGPAATVSIGAEDGAQAPPAGAGGEVALRPVDAFDNDSLFSSKPKIAKDVKTDELEGA